MKYWYYGICDKCSVARTVMVDGPIRSNLYLEDSNHNIAMFMREHYAHGLRLELMENLPNDFYDNYIVEDEKDEPQKKTVKRNIKI